MDIRTLILIAAACLTAGAAADAVAGCVVEPDSLDFGSVIEGTTAELSFEVTNDGPATVTGVMTVDSAFRFAGGAQSRGYSIAPGAVETVTLTVTSYGNMEYDGRVDLGAVAAGCESPYVYCHAECQMAPWPGEPICGRFTPGLTFEFPPTGVGDEAIDDLWVVNHGGVWPDPQRAGIVEGVMPAFLGDWEVQWPGPFAVTNIQTWNVVFRPTEPGPRTYELMLPGFCESVILTGIGLIPGTACDVSVSSLDLPPVPVGRTAYGTFIVTNLGTDDLLLTIPAACGDFVVTNGPDNRLLYPAEEYQVNVAFTPRAPGPQTCSLDLGVCDPVPLTGMGLQDDGAPDRIGVWFEQTGLVDRHDTAVPFEEVTAYLMILNPSTPYGASGWECCVEIQGDVVAPNWQLAGEVFNAEVPPCFSVGSTGEPLYGDRVILLGTLTFLQPDPDAPTAIYVHPGTSPSLPGVPVYANGADPGHLIPMTWASGAEAMPVAVVNEPLVDATPTRAVTRLHPGQPNPFNPSTTLAFTMGERSRARLEIYDVQGRRVRTLVDEELAVGVHERVWDGRDDAGRQQVSGVYFGRLEAGGVPLITKLVLLK